MLKKLLLSFVIAGLILVTQLGRGTVARADGTCGPGLTYDQYYSASCVYGIPYIQNTDSNVVIYVYLDPSFPAHIASDVLSAMNNWQNSGAHVRMSQVSSQSSANMTIWASTSGYNFSHSCNAAWGQSWYGGTALYHEVLLNSYNFSTCVNSSGQTVSVADGEWVGVAVHEMGHAMGLQHNAYNNGAVNMRMNANAQHLRDGSPMLYPQYTDYYMLNTLYPDYIKSCPSAPSNYACNGMDPGQLGCPAYGQETDNNPYGWVTLYYSGVTCKANWTKGGATASGWKIYRIQINRSSGTDGGAITIEDIPNVTSWYTNMVYSPNNSARSCISYISSSGTTTGFYCTAWH